MGRFTTIPQNAFDALQLDAGVLLRHFDIAAASASSSDPGFTDADIICATTGGINPTCEPTYSDFAEDVDNAPNNLKEFKHLDGWDAKIATTSLGTSPELIALSLGASDVDGGKICPRRDLKQTDFSDLWWVGDKANGGFVAIRLMNALSTGGFSLQTTKNGKGQVKLEITGHVSIKAQKVVPMEFYSIDPDTLSAVTVSPEAGSTDMWGTLVSDMQENVSVVDDRISGTLYKQASGQIVTDWGEGYFIALKFTDLDPEATSVKVGLSPSQGSGLVEIINDPDKNGVFKITNKITQKFVVVSTDGDRERTQEYDLSGLVLVD